MSCRESRAQRVEGTDPENFAGILANIHKFGMLRVTGALDTLGSRPQAARKADPENAKLKEFDRHMQGERIKMDRYLGNLGAVSDRYGIERRGAEMHIELINHER